METLQSETHTQEQANQTFADIYREKFKYVGFKEALGLTPPEERTEDYLHGNDIWIRRAVEDQMLKAELENRPVNMNELAGAALDKIRSIKQAYGDVVHQENLEEKADELQHTADVFNGKVISARATGATGQVELFSGRRDEYETLSHNYEEVKTQNEQTEAALSVLISKAVKISPDNKFTYSQSFTSAIESVVEQSYEQTILEASKIRAIREAEANNVNTGDGIRIAESASDYIRDQDPTLPIDVYREGFRDRSVRDLGAVAAERMLKADDTKHFGVSLHAN